MNNPELKQTTREQCLHQWVTDDCGVVVLHSDALPSDASMRRYFRLTTPERKLIAMDAPPPQENCRPFVTIAQTLRAQGLHAPKIFHADVEQGFLLLEDFGDATYLSSLTTANADPLYQCALKALVTLQAVRDVPQHTLPVFNADFMFKEWAWHQEWFLDKFLGLPLGQSFAAVDKEYGLIVSSASEQPQVFMHRDYHAGNLMLLNSGNAMAVGILDFQDAFMGPVTYDLVSLLRDCYIDWPLADVLTWMNNYFIYLQARGDLGDVSPTTFLRWFDWMGIQRHLKALLTFARKHVRDGQSRYLAFMPRTLNYLLTTTQHYPELAALHEFLRVDVQPRMLKKTPEVNVCVP